MKWLDELEGKYENGSRCIDGDRHIIHEHELERLIEIIRFSEWFWNDGNPCCPVCQTYQFKAMDHYASCPYSDNFKYEWLSKNDGHKPYDTKR